MKTTAVCAIAAALASAGAASAADRVPTRAPGLWEITTITNAGRTGARECIDERTDRLVRQAVSAQSCTDDRFKETPEGYVSAAGCKMQGLSAESRIVVTGDFQTWARAQTSTVMVGVSGGQETKNFSTTIETRRIGDCEPGQTAGDIILPNGKVIHVGSKAGR